MVDLAPDGAWLVYVEHPSSRLWRARADGTQRRPLTEAPLEVALPRWSPDGARVAFQARAPGGAWRIFEVPAAGGGPVSLVDGGDEQTDPGWSPDGRSLFFADTESPAGRQTLRRLDLATGRVSEVPGSEGTSSPRPSPDGRHLAALSADGGKLLVLDLETGEWSEPVVAPLSFPTWSKDGSFLYYQTRDLAIHRLRRSDGRTETVVSRAGVPPCGFIGWWFGLDPEGRVLVMREEGAAELFDLEYAYR
jgi:Tol biopolymer transport system component